VEIAANTPRDWLRFQTKAIKPGEWNQHTFRFEKDTFAYLINGTPIYKEPRQTSAPWIALQSQGWQSAGARNLRFTGQPRIGRTLNLLPDETLRDWSSQYYPHLLPTGGLNQDVQEPEALPPMVLRVVAKVDRLEDLAWTFQDGELISGKASDSHAVGPAGPPGERVVRYDRPLLDGETLSYEFYYEKGKMAVHPAMGRTAYVLRPAGVHLHWMAEAGDHWKLPEDYEAPAYASDPPTVPLKEADWNRVAVQLNTNQLQIRVNEELVFEKPIEILPQGSVFGLFHNTDQTKARIRNVTLTGAWPETVPDNLYTESEIR
jgi:hypothetical protein